MVLSLPAASAPAASAPGGSTESKPFTTLEVREHEFQYRDLYTRKGLVITAAEQRADAAKALRRADPERFADRDPVPAAVVRYPNGAIGLRPPVPLSEQPPDDEPRSTSTISEAEKRHIGDIVSELKKPSGTFTDHGTGIIGDVDDRVRLTPTDFYVRNARGLLQDAGQNGSYNVCTAVLYSTSHIVTAAHCLWNPDTDAWRPTPFTFHRGVDGDADPPNYPACYTDDWVILDDYRDNHEAANDLGWARLNCSVPGASGTEHVPLVALPEVTALTYFDGLRIAGYPVFHGEDDVTFQQWSDEGQMTDGWPDYLLTGDVDATGGQSGGAWSIPCEDHGWVRCAVGIHKGDYSVFGQTLANTGHRFTAGEIATLASYAELEPPC